MRTVKILAIAAFVLVALVTILAIPHADPMAKQLIVEFFNWLKSGAELLVVVLVMLIFYSW